MVLEDKIVIISEYDLENYTENYWRVMNGIINPVMKEFGYDKLESHIKNDMFAEFEAQLRFELAIKIEENEFVRLIV